MTTDFRAMCAELLDLLRCFGSTFNIPIETSVVIRARTLLAQPEGEELTDEALLELMPQQFRDDLATVSRLASYGTPVEPGIYRVSLNTGALDFARAAIAADRARSPTPQPPVDKEVAALVARLRDWHSIPLLAERERAAELLQRQHLQLLALDNLRNECDISDETVLKLAREWNSGFDSIEFEALPDFIRETISFLLSNHHVQHSTETANR